MSFHPNRRGYDFLLNESSKVKYTQQNQDFYIQQDWKEMMLLVSSEGVLRKVFVFMKCFEREWMMILSVYHLPSSAENRNKSVVNAFWLPRQRTGTKIVLHWVLFGSEPKHIWYQLNSKILSNVKFVCINFIICQSLNITIWVLFRKRSTFQFLFQQLKNMDWIFCKVVKNSKNMCVTFRNLLGAQKTCV